jgi:hypothetical protein
MWMSAKDHLVLAAVIDQLNKLLLGLVTGEVEYFIPQLTYSTKPSPTCRLPSLFVNVMRVYYVVCYHSLNGVMIDKTISDR